MPFRRRGPMLAVMCLCAALTSGAGSHAAAQSEAENTFATEIVNRMANFLDSADALTYTSLSATVAAAAEEPPSTLHATVHVAVRRPDRLWVDLQSEEVHNRFLYDGATLQIQHLLENLYATHAATGNIRQLLDAVENELGIFIPLGAIWGGDSQARIMEGVEAITYLGIQDVEGVPCHHIHARQSDLSWQVWIEDGVQPVPRKVSIHFMTGDVSNTFSSVLSEWDFAPHLPDSVFNQSPPPNAQRIELQRLASGSN